MKSSKARELDALNTVDEVAQFAKVSVRTVYRAIESGRLKTLRAGNQVHITDRAAWAWFEGDYDVTARGDKLRSLRSL